MVHAALLLLMLEAINADLVFTISLKRSTQNLSAIHKLAGRLPHLLGVKRTWIKRLVMSAFDPKRTSQVFHRSDI
jgi:hypothetical protein